MGSWGVGEDLIGESVDLGVICTIQIRIILIDSPLGSIKLLKGHASQLETPHDGRQSLMARDFLIFLSFWSAHEVHRDESLLLD